MGRLVIKAYPTKMAIGLADHTYVECGTGRVGWKCFGGKTGGHALESESGSTKRADAIAEPDEHSGLNCYMVNGVCHQAANRIWTAAGITVEGARGYGVSRGMFSVYGRVGVWPCKSPFDAHAGVKGDLAACVGGDADTDATEANGMSESQAADAALASSLLGLYQANSSLFDLDTQPALEEIEAFHLQLFATLLDLRLGPLAEDQRDQLLAVRRSIEQRHLEIDSRHAAGSLDGLELAAAVDELAVDLQRQMASEMSDEQYQSLFELPKDELVSVAELDELAEPA